VPATVKVRAAVGAATNAPVSAITQAVMATS
jgi:hypothetical protein